MTIYCSNCETEATQVAQHDGKVTPLCETCATAYEWGMASPEANLIPVYDAVSDGIIEDEPLDPDKGVPDEGEDLT